MTDVTIVDLDPVPILTADAVVEIVQPGNATAGVSYRTSVGQIAALANASTFALGPLSVLGVAGATAAIAAGIAATGADQVLRVNSAGNAIAWGAINLATSAAVTGALRAVNGGTGQTAYVVGDLLYADTATTLARIADVATGNVLLAGGVGVAPSWGKLPGTALATMAGLSVLGVTGTASAAPAAITGTAGQFLQVNAAGTGLVFGAGAAVPVTAPNGGTGQTTYVAGDLLYATNATTLSRLADVATGNVLLAGGVGVIPAWGKVANAALATMSAKTLKGNVATAVASPADLNVNQAQALIGLPIENVVSNYGAVGNGVADDTAAIVSALTGAANQGSILIFPPGTYLTDPIAIQGSSANVPRGIGGYGAILKARAAATTTPLVTIDSPDNVWPHFFFNGFRLDCNSLHGYGLKIHGSGNCQYQDIHIKNALLGGMWLSGEPSFGIYYNNFSNIYAQTCVGPGLIAKSINNTSTYYIAANAFVNCQFQFCSTYGADLDYASIAFLDCDFEGNTSANLNINHSIQVDLFGCHVETGTAIVDNAANTKGVRVVGGRLNGAVSTALISNTANFFQTSDAAGNPLISQVTGSTFRGNPTATFAAPLDMSIASARTMLELGMVLINTISISNVATAGDLTSITSTYNDYLITFQNIIPATNTTDLRIQLHTSGGFNVTNYLDLGGNTTFILLGSGLGTTASAGYAAALNLYNVNSTSNFKWMRGVGSYLIPAGTVSAANPAGLLQQTAVVDGFQIVMSSGNLSSGTVKIYGLRSAL